MQKENRARCDSPFLDLFGMQFYQDDLILLGILFFLYSEGIQDEELFVCLILLLLT